MRNSNFCQKKFVKLKVHLHSIEIIKKMRKCNYCRKIRQIEGASLLYSQNIDKVCISNFLTASSVAIAVLGEAVLILRFCRCSLYNESIML